MVFVAIGFALLGVLLMGLSLPMSRGELPPNRAVGLRTAATLADPAVWYAANAAAGRDLFRLGAVISAAAVVLPVVLGPTATPVLLVGTVAGLLGVAIGGAMRASRLRARAERDGAPPDVAPKLPPAE